MYHTNRTKVYKIKPYFLFQFQVVATLYYNPNFLTTILEKLHLPDSHEPVTVQFFAQWMDDASCFLG